MLTRHTTTKLGGLLFTLAALATPALAGDANIRIPDLNAINFNVFGNAVNGHTLLYLSIVACLVGIGFVAREYWSLIAKLKTPLAWIAANRKRLLAKWKEIVR